MIGKTISHYKIESKLGAGGMGEVFLATDLELDRPVALKFLADSLMRDDDAQARFLQEARSASKISHPNVVAVHAIEKCDAACFIVMEYIKGKTLQSVIDAGPIPIPAACELVKQVASGLAFAHELNIVHRDVKPSNVMITESGTAKIMDFGLAQLPGTSLITVPGAVLGTVAYMAPEQIQALDVDARADVFSLGVLFYELLTGERPFKGDHGPALMYSVVYDDPPPVRDLRPEIAPQLEEIVATTLAKSREARYADGRAFLEALKAVDQPTTTAKRPPAPTAPDVPSIRSLAVLYLRNLGLPGDEFLSYGVTEDLIVDLARLGNLRVAPMRSVLQFKDSLAQLDDVARTLNATLILDGSIYRSDRMIRVSAQLVDVTDKRTLWANRWEEPPENLPRIKNDLAAGIVEALHIETLADGSARPAPGGAGNPQAYKAYLRGKFVFDHMNSASEADVALGLFRQAISIEPSLVGAFAGIGEVLMHQGQYDRTIKELTPALDEARRRQQKPDETTILKLLSRAHDRLGQWNDALDCGHQALGIARDLGDLAGEADALGHIISVLRKQSKNELAMAMFQRVVEINRQLGDRERALNALFEMGILYENMKDYTRARGLFEEALGAAREQGNQSLIARGLTLVGSSCFNDGNFAEAMQNFCQALDIGKRLGDQDRIGECTTDIGLVHMVRGEYHDALNFLNKAVEMAHAAGGRRAKAIALAQLTLTECILGSYDRATEHAREASASASELNLADIKTLAMHRIGTVHLYRGNYDAAVTQFRESITYAEQNDVAIFIGSSLIGLAAAFHYAHASNASLACAESVFKIASKSDDKDLLFLSSAYIGAAEVTLGQFESGIQKLYDSLGDAQKSGDFLDNLVVQRLLGQALFERGPSDDTREQGRRILQKALSSATERAVPHEVNWINMILARSR